MDAGSNRDFTTGIESFTLMGRRVRGGRTWLEEQMPEP
jgi:hypothetical protein